MRLVFMGTPAFAVPSLRRLTESGFTIAAVVTQPDRPAGRGGHVAPSAVKETARQLGLPVEQPPSLRAPEAIAHLRELAPDVIVVVAYGQILRRAVLDLPPLGCVNVHPSLLPKLRGASPIQSAIREGFAETGVSIMLMDERMDAGPILNQARFSVRSDDTAASLGERLAEAGANLLVETLQRWAAHAIEPVPQVDADATYCKPLRKEEAIVDWSRSAVEIDRACRAQTPWPGCQSDWGDRPLRLLALQPLPSWTGSERPGTVVAAKDPTTGQSVLAVATGGGAVRIQTLQLPGKRPLTAAEFLRGYPGIMGSVLTSTRPS